MTEERKMKKAKPLPAVLDTAELCKELVIMAGFVVNPKIRETIYKAVRQLKLLDKLAVDAGILPPS